MNQPPLGDFLQFFIAAMEVYAVLTELDDPARGRELERIIRGKKALRRIYEEIYESYASCLKRCPEEGLVVELGSGGGFVKERIPEILSTDVHAYGGVDQVVDAMDMPFDDESLSALFMLNVFHHIPEVSAFLAEAERVLKPGARLLIVDQYPSLLSRPIYRFLHDEPFDPQAREWSFPSTGSLSGANGAMAWIVFERDLAQFRQDFPRLEMQSFRPHSPLRYWLAGGLKGWTLLPGWAFPVATAVDHLLAGISLQFCSFVNVELRRLRSAS